MRGFAQFKIDIVTWSSENAENSKKNSSDRGSMWNPAGGTDTGDTSCFNQICSICGLYPPL